jgi:CBS domain-containing protein
MRITEVLRLKGDEVATLSPEATVRELLAVLAERRIGAVVVSRDGRHVEGIVSERDVVRRLHGADQDAVSALLAGPLAAIMTTEVRTCEPGDKLEDLMAAMTEHRVRHIPVLVDGELAGLVSIGDVVKHRLAEVQAERDHLTAYITG